MFWKFTYPSLELPFTDGQFHHEYPVTAFYSDFRECSQNSRGPPCDTIFMRFVTHFPVFMGYRMEVVAILANFANVLKTRIAI